MTLALDLTPRIAAPDDLYNRLVALHEGLDEQRSLVVLYKLVLLLANHVGDTKIVEEAIELARAQHR